MTDSIKCIEKIRIEVKIKICRTTEIFVGFSMIDPPKKRRTREIYLFINGLFVNAVSSSDYTVSNKRMIND
jgi:hypothetical protein